MVYEKSKKDSVIHYLINTIKNSEAIGKVDEVRLSSDQVLQMTGNIHGKNLKLEFNLKTIVVIF